LASFKAHCLENPRTFEKLQLSLAVTQTIKSSKDFPRQLRQELIKTLTLLIPLLKKQYLT
jgi:hypothetical protein